MSVNLGHGLDRDAMKNWNSYEPAAWTNLHITRGQCCQNR